MPSQPRSCVERAQKRKRKGDEGRRAEKNRRKQRQEPGVRAKKAKDAYFISRHRL